MQSSVSLLFSPQHLLCATFMNQALSQGKLRNRLYCISSVFPVLHISCIFRVNLCLSSDKNPAVTLKIPVILFPCKALCIQSSIWFAGIELYPVDEFLSCFLDIGLAEQQGKRIRERKGPTSNDGNIPEKRRKSEECQVDEVWHLT